MTDAEIDLLNFVKAYVAKRKRMKAISRANYKATFGIEDTSKWPGRNAIPFLHDLVRMVDGLENKENVSS